MTDIKRIADLNAFTFSFDEEILSELRASYERFVLPYLKKRDFYETLSGKIKLSGAFGRANHRYYCTNDFIPTLLWVSSNNKATYAPFRALFDKFDIEDFLKDRLDFEKDIVLYCGFYMIGNQTPSENWHVDYYDSSNAFTLICPLFDVDSAHGGLLYKDQRGRRNRYQYKSGEAIFFGESFEHSTEPYPQSEKLRVLVSMTFGTDKLKYWSVLKDTIGTQSNFVIMPCGHQMGRCKCLEKSIGSVRETKEALKWAARHETFKYHETISEAPWGTTIRLYSNCDSTDAYLKILPESRVSEPEATAVLSKHFPKIVPQVSAYDSARRLLLTSDHGGADAGIETIKQAYNALKTYATMQSEALTIPELFQVLPKFDSYRTVADVMHCLCPERSASTSNLAIRSPAKDFIGQSDCEFYWDELNQISGVLEAVIARSVDLPVTVTHGDFHFGNLAERPDGTAVIYDWGEALAGPAGLSLSNPLFLGPPSRGLRILANVERLAGNGLLLKNLEFLHCTIQSLEQIVGTDVVYGSLLCAYLDALVEAGYSKHEQLLAGMGGSLVAGSLRWLTSWSLEEGYTDGLREVTGNWWRDTLDDVLKLGYLVETNSLTEEIDQGEVERRIARRGNAVVRGEGDNLVLTDFKARRRYKCNALTAAIWDRLSEPSTVGEIVERTGPLFPQFSQDELKLIALNILASLADRGLLEQA